MLRGQHAAILSVMLAASASPSRAQPVDQPRPEVDAIVRAVESESDCRVTLLGEPELDELAGRWLVAYSSAGEGCDEAVESLQRRGEPLAVAFFRRPNAEQVSALVNRMIRGAEAGTGCRITLRGQPYLDSAQRQWIVSYVGAGTGCDDAADLLRREGAPLLIVFSGLHTDETLLR